MHTSIASYRSQNHERDKVRELIPQYLRDGATNLISFMEEYYDYLNRDGFASYELAHIIDEKCIILLTICLNSLLELTTPTSRHTQKIMGIYQGLIKYRTHTFGKILAIK